METTINALAQLGGTVFTVVAFLYFLDRNTKSQTEAQIKLATALENLTNKIIYNSNASNSNTVALNKNTAIT